LKGIWAVPILAGILLLSVGLSLEAWAPTTIAPTTIASTTIAPTTIAPTDGEPGHGFVLIDTSDGRIADGAKAVFTLNGASTEVDLITQSGTVAYGSVPEVGGGDYTVSFKLPDGTVIDVGNFEVTEPV